MSNAEAQNLFAALLVGGIPLLMGGAAFYFTSGVTLRCDRSRRRSQGPPASGRNHRLRREKALVRCTKCQSPALKWTPLRRGTSAVASVVLPAPCWKWARPRLRPARSGLEVVTLEVRRAEDIAPAFEALKGRAQALYVVSADPLLITNRIRINTLSNIARLPMITTQREFVEAGGLMSYGPNYSGLFHHAADYVDKILRGAKLADIPVEQPTKFDLVINLTTARALGLTIPESFLLRADEVVE
jgi:hypothetical protein